MRNRVSGQIATIAAALVAVCVAAGCNGGDGGATKAGMPAVTPPENQSEVRNFTRVELDTLRALKERNGITRDEYWDDRGGVLANDVLEVWYPPGKLTVSHGMYVLDRAMRCRREIGALFEMSLDQKLTVVCSQTMEAYTEFTGRQWWNYSSIEPDRIIYQPVPVLAARGLLDIALPREVYVWAIATIGGGRAPRWMVVGLASRLALEEDILEDNLGEFPDEPVKMSLADMEAALEADNDKKRVRIAYYNAYMMVKRLEEEYTRHALAAMIRAIGNGSDVEAAAQAAFGRSYDDVVAFAQGWERPAPQPEEAP